MIEDADPRIHAGIAVILGQMDEAPEEAIRALEELLDDELPSVRKAAQDSIEALRKKMAAGTTDGSGGSN